MPDFDLSRFHQAQTPVWDAVEAELAAGRKQTHWMWFVFPQLGGLGSSDMARRYGIADIDHARRYLADPVLGARLRQAVGLVLGHADRSARAIFGSPDDLKFRSSVTLFGRAAATEADRALFRRALEAFYAGAEDPATVLRLRG